MSRFKDLTNQSFGKWTVIERSSKKRRWICRCECSTISHVLSYHLISGASTQCRNCSNTAEKLLDIGKVYGELTIVENFKVDGTTFVKSRCSCGRIVNRTLPCYISSGKTTKCKFCYGWKGYQDISGAWWNNQKKQALERDIIFNLRIEDIWNVYIQQGKRCALSGLPIQFTRTPSKNCIPQTASLDRIDNNMGYTIDNIQLVHKKINFMKHINTQEDFINFCNLVAIKHKRTPDPNKFIYQEKCT